MSEWPITLLSSVAKVSPPGPPLAPESPFIPMDAVRVGERFPHYSEPRGTRGGIRARANDVLFARITPSLENGKVGQVPSGWADVGGSTEFLVLRPGPLLDPGYLYYWCLTPSIREAAQRNLVGVTGRMRLGKAALEQFPIALPPLEQQRRLVETLEEHLSRLDTAAVSLTSIIPKRLDVLRFSAVRSRLQSNSTKVTLSELVSVSTGGVWGRPPGDDEVDVDVIRVTEMLPFGELAESHTRRSITKRQLDSRLLQAGDLLLEKSGGGPKTPVGRVGLVRGLARPTVCSNFMQLMRPRVGISARYLHLLLNNFYDSGGTSSMQKASTNIRNIKSSEYLELRFPVPPLPEQSRIVQEIEPILKAIESLRRDTRQAFARLQTLRSASLQAAMSGRLAGRSSDLDRIEELVP